MVTSRPRRKKSFFPSSPSSSPMCSESVGCDEWILFAARLKLFSRATARNTSSWRSVISGFPYSQNPNYVLDPIAPTGVLQLQTPKGGPHDLSPLSVPEDRLRQLPVRLRGRRRLRCGGSTARDRALPRGGRAEVHADHAHLRDACPGRSPFRGPSSRGCDGSPRPLPSVRAGQVPSCRDRGWLGPRSGERAPLDPPHARAYARQRL